MANKANLKTWLRISVFLLGVSTGPALAGVLYPDPPGGWAYTYTGDAAVDGPTNNFDSLDGSWDNNNNSDQWDGSQIGSGRPGGASALSEAGTNFLRLQDTGNPADYGMEDPNSNRKIFFGHSITNDIGTAGNTILDYGVTISFRARLSTMGPLDDVFPAGVGEPYPWPTGGDGYVLHDGGKDNFGVRQLMGDKIISFALALEADSDYGELTTDGLVMNDLADMNSTQPSDAVDQQDNDGGTLNFLPIADLTVWHEFWITIEADNTMAGTHLVKVYMDGSTRADEFIVTAGNGNDYDDSYISLGVGATPQSGAIDIDFFSYKRGCYRPMQAEIFVDDDAPGDPGPGDPGISDPLEDGSPEHPFDAIQEAIDVAQTEETVIVLDGIYMGTGNRNINFWGRPITVRSLNGPNNCTIDCEQLGIGFEFLSGEDTNSVVDGFTITNGLYNGEGGGGGGICCSNGSNPIITNCIITANTSEGGDGGGIYCILSSPTILNCTISGNKALNGGAIFLDHSNATISNCTIRNNEALSGWGGGICSFYYGSPIISNCTISNNNSAYGGGGIYGDSNPTIADCTISDNSPDGVWNTGYIRIAGTVRIISNNLVGTGNYQIKSNATLVLEDCRVTGTSGYSVYIFGLGTIQVPAGKEAIFEDYAWVWLYDPNDPNAKGTIQCNGLLKAMDYASIRNAQVYVTRPYGKFFVKDMSCIIDNEIHADGDRCVDLDPPLFAGTIEDNRIFVTITEGQNNTPAGLFELRGQDMFCPEPPCEPGAFPLWTIPDFNQVTWTIERFELLDGAIVRLTNRLDFQWPWDEGGENEVLYVKQLVLGPGSILDTAFNRLYYETIEMHPTAQIINEPLLNYPLDNMEFDDYEEFVNRVVHNNFIDPDEPDITRIHVEHVVGLEPDPHGMMQMRNLKDIYGQMVNARAKGFFAKTTEDEILIRFKYLFETSEPGVELVVYLSDVPYLLDPYDPLREEHYLEVARLPAPPVTRPGSAGSRRFGVFEKTVSTEYLNFIEGTWIELELVGPQSGEFFSAAYSQGESTGSEDPSVLVDSWNPAVQCYGICLDINFDTSADEIDFLTVIGECGLTASGDRACLDGVFSDDGIVDLFDVVSWDWAMNSDDRLLNFCGVPLVSGGEGMVGAASVSFEASGGSAPPVSLPSGLSDLLIAGKRSTSGDPQQLKSKDRLYVFDSNGLCVGWSSPASDRCNIRLVQDLQGQLYQLNSETGVRRLGDTNEVIVPPGYLAGVNEPRYNKSATIYVGIQDGGSDSFARPVFDAAFDANDVNYVYVVPVVVNPDGNEPYTAAAKLQLLGAGNPPYQVVQLYDDPPLPGDNQYRNALREIELDSAGNLYVLNAHSLNESDILWRYDPNGSIERIDLGIPDSNNYLPAPVGMYMSDATDMLYLASARYNLPDVNSTVICGFSTQGTLSLQRSVTINNMQHVTSITEDLTTGSLWVVGFNMQNAPPYPDPADPPFYRPYLAEVPYDSNSVLPLSIYDPNSHDLALPTSVLWTRSVKCGGADLNESGDVSFADYAILAKYWLDPNCAPPGWCEGADIDISKTVDVADLAILAQNWLKTGCLN